MNLSRDVFVIELNCIGYRLVTSRNSGTRVKPVNPLLIIFSKASTRTSCVDIMTPKDNDWQVGNSCTPATGYLLCAETTGSDLFYQFRSRGFLQVACVTSVSRSCANQCQSMNDFCVVIDWSSIDRYQSIPARDYEGERTHPPYMGLFQW